MNNLLLAVFLTLLPVFELRGGIPFAILMGFNPYFTFLLLTLVNILLIFFIFFFLDYLHKNFLKIRFYNLVFNKYLDSKRGKLEKYIGSKWESFILFLLVAVPLPGTGAYTGCLLAWFFKVNRRNAYISIALGVIVAGILVSLASVGIIRIF